METKLTTLCYMERGGEYLMLHRTKKENDENRDKWIGVGGKFEPGESPEDCLRREVREETGLTLTRWRYRGLVTFVSDVWPCEYMHLFTADAWTGEQRPCDEGELAWIGKDELLTKKLWAGDRDHDTTGFYAPSMAHNALPQRPCWGIVVGGHNSNCF